MSKWRIWEDSYWGDSWNDRREISYPEFEGMELSDDQVEEELLSRFIPEVRKFVEIDGDEEYVQATMAYCLGCDSPVTLCECGDDDDHFTYLGFHATKVV